MAHGDMIWTVFTDAIETAEELEQSSEVCKPGKPSNTS